MAQEITVSARLNVNKGGATATGDVTKQITLAGEGKFTNVQAIGIAEEQIVFPADLVTEGVGYIWLKNLDAVNFVQIKQNIAGTKNIFARLNPGEIALFRTAKAAASDPDLWAIADTAAINLQIVASGT